MSRNNDDSKRKVESKINVVRKVFFFPEKVILNESSKLKIERFFHPSRDTAAFFLVEMEGDKLPKKLFEIIEFAEPRRTWMTDRNICANGKAYIVVPIDVTFLVLHQLRKFCSERALSLDNIVDDGDENVFRLMNEYTTEEMLMNVADVKKLDDLTFYKYNSSKSLAWLALKVKKLATRIRYEGINCGLNSLSENYCKVQNELSISETDYLRNACEIVGNYLAPSLLQELLKYLGVDDLENDVKTSENVKRKSLQKLNGTDSKKPKLTDETLFQDEAGSKETEVKEKKVSAKCKALAKSAKGTKSIASFFKK